MGSIWNEKIFTVDNNGVVPKPTSADVAAGNVLKADGTWGAGGGGGNTESFEELLNISRSNMEGFQFTESVTATRI